MYVFVFVHTLIENGLRLANRLINERRTTSIINERLDKLINQVVSFVLWLIAFCGWKIHLPILWYPIRPLDLSIVFFKFQESLPTISPTKLY